MTYEERFEILKATGRMDDDADAKRWAKKPDCAVIYIIEELRANYSNSLEDIFICGETDEEEIAELKAQFDLLLEGKLVNDYWDYATVDGIEYAINFSL